MKIIQVVGSSGSGKTTFIRELCPVLQKRGRIGTIKHLGHHRYELTPGKDTTLFFETGIDASIGIDDEKTVMTVRTASIHKALCSLADLGMDYCIIEGFKQHTYSRVVIGDLKADALLRNPSVSDVVTHLPDFDDFFTMPSQAGMHQKEQAVSTCVISYLFKITGTDGVSNPDSQIKVILASLAQKELPVRVEYLHPVYHFSTEQPKLGIIIDSTAGIDTALVNIVLSDVKEAFLRAGLQIHP